MSDNENERAGFSQDYVKELRQENASWRTKVRDLEQQLRFTEIKTELLKHGADVNPKWVDVDEGQSVRDAVNTFLAEYPQFISNNNNISTTNKEPTFKKVTKPEQASKSDSNHPGPKPNNGNYGGRSLNEIKKDPKARASLRDQYRQLLAQQSNQEYGD